MTFSPDYSEQALTLSQVDALPGDTLLDFGENWCGYCQAASPFVEEALTTSKDIPHLKILDGKGKKLGRSFGVKLWPTLIALKDGREIARLVRPTSTEDVRALLTAFD